MNEYLLGIDLGGTNVKVAVVTRDGVVIAKEKVKTHAKRGLDHVIQTMADAALGLLAKSGIDKSAILAAGIGAPGPMNWQTGIVYAPPNLPGWKDVPLAQLMQDRLGIRSFVDNDANCACYGEFWRGAGRDVQHMCLMTLGTGVGGGIVIWGRLLRGLDGTAGEIGHMTVEHNGRPCGCGSHGCLEAYASATGLVRTAMEGLDNGVETALRGFLPDDVTSRTIAELARDGDLFCTSVVQETGRWLGVAAADLINLLNPEMIAFAGGLADAGDILFDPIRGTAKAMAFEVPARRARIVRAELGTNAGVIGAAGCALHRLENGGDA
jgi:glucokinase